MKILSKSFKPSNFQSFVKKKLIEGRIASEIDFYLENDIHPIIETECFTSEKLENIYNLFNK